MRLRSKVANFSARQEDGNTTLLICRVVVLLGGCESREQPVEEGEMVLAVSRPAFQEGGKVPAKYTCEGQDVLSALTWIKPPAETQHT